ncbi:MAG: hypothetical protein ACPLIG_08485 [Candidatus Bathyarchaeales archaeon]
MKWKKMGLIYCPSGKQGWDKHSALQPTPIILDDEILRVYVGFRDDEGVSRVGFVDLDVKDPSKILYTSEEPALDVGDDGTFDDNGVVPCAIIQRMDKFYLYYAGYQLVKKVKFLVFGGLAISDDGGFSFKRYSKTPIVDRTDDELYFRVIHSLIFEKGVWKAWYGGGSKFIKENDRILPSYNVRYMESKDGINFPKKGNMILDFIYPDEYRIGRPYVIKDGGVYKMFYGYATKSNDYRLGYAESKDGVNWNRKDEDVGITVSKSGWDSKMMAYPAVVKWNDKVYLLYNGNNMGKTGFGYAILEHW